MSDLDISKAILGTKDWFPLLTGVRPVRLAGLVARREPFTERDTPLLVVERPEGSVALLAPR
jgi:hypothetical protein